MREPAVLLPLTFLRSSLLRSPSPPLSLLADRCASMRQLLQVHAQMVVRGHIHDNYAASRLLSFAATSRSGDLWYAVQLLEHTPVPNSYMWNTLIRGHADGATPKEAISAFIRMLRLGDPPGKHTLPFVLKAYANCGAGSDCVQAHSLVLKHGLGSDVYVVNGLIRCYASAGMLRDARKVFEGAPERSLVVWTTMISGYAQNACSCEALTLFGRMAREEGLEPNDVTLASVLSACARSGDLALGEQIHRFTEEKGMHMGVVLGTALVDMYAKNGEISKAHQLFRAMTEKNNATWNAIICGLAHHGHPEDAIELFRELEKTGLAPNDVSFVGVLSACCHAGLVDVGRAIFHTMEAAHGVEPKIEHYGCMVNLLGRCGRLEEAENLLNGMIREPDVAVLGALLTACEKHRNLDIAVRVAKKMLDLEPNKHGVYVVLSNICAQVGNWDAVIRLRKMMRVGNLKKIPGWSCVDNEDDGN